VKRRAIDEKRTLFALPVRLLLASTYLIMYVLYVRSGSKSQLQDQWKGKNEFRDCAQSGDRHVLSGRSCCGVRLRVKGILDAERGECTESSKDGIDCVRAPELGQVLDHIVLVSVPNVHPPKDKRQRRVCGPTIIVMQ
jgi:hypothetical protein